MSQFNRGPQGGGGGPRSGPSGHGPQRPAPRDETVASYWPGYLVGGYFDTKENLKIEYVSRGKVEPLVRAMCSRDSLTSHQIRRYFGHCRAIETQLQGGGWSWESVWPEIKKLDVAAADGLAKRPPKIPPLFHDFIRQNVAAIQSERDFLRGFLPHFEALVGFGSAHFRKDRS